MAKSIRLLGATYSDVPAVDLPKSGGGTARFADIDETALVVTLSWDEDYFDEGEGAWVPDKTFAEVQSAVLAGRQITAEGPTIYDDVAVDCIWSADDQCLYYMVYFIYNNGDVFTWKQQVYSLSQNGITRVYEDYISQPSGTIAITSAGTVDVTNYAEVSVPQGEIWVGANHQFYTESGARKWRYRGEAAVDYRDGSGTPGFIADETYVNGSWNSYNAVASGTSVTPTESAQTIGGSNYMMEGPVTVNAIPSSYVGSGITRRDSTDLSASGATVSVPAGYYASSASKAVASGSVTASATKGSVSNHSVQVTPSASVTAGYISSGASGTPVTVQASELVSGSQSITENDTYDVTNLAEVVVNVQGGGGTGLQTDSKTATLSAAASSVSFTGLSAEPTSFAVYPGSDQTTGSPAHVVAVVFDGQSMHGQTATTTSNANASYDTGFTKSYSNGTLTVTATTASFQAATWTLDYTYGGGSIETSDVQVGSGATSISFTGLEDEPVMWSCIFKSNFSTSSGYQRVMFVRDDGTGHAGFCLDSSAHYSASYWTSSYSNGTLTITSQGTNAGGYFHQPGYYQLTYALDTSGNYQSKTVTPTTSQQVVQADSGYDALKKVTVNAIPSEYIIPTGNIAITSNTGTGQSLDVSQYATATVSVPTGGGGATVATKSVTASNRPSSLAFSSLSGQPIMFALKATFTMTSSSSTYYYVDSMRGYLSNGSYTVQGRLFQMGSTRQTMNVQTGYSATYSGGTLTLSSTGNRTTSPGCFYNGSYELVYVY